MKRVSVTKAFTFNSAHYLPYYDGSCSRLHGHTYKLHVTVSDDVDIVTGMVVDFGFLKEIVDKEIVSVYDHENLNKFIDNPTAENMVVEIFNKLDKVFSTRGYQLVSVKLWETDDSYAECERV